MTLWQVACVANRHETVSCQMNPAVSPPVCLTCGACCFSQLPTYVQVSGDDWSRLGEQAEKVAHFIGIRAYMKMEAGHCSALAIRRSAGGVAEYFCTIYDRRPQVCRDLARGSPQCQAELEQKAARAEAAGIIR